jgi:hypothetical protein
VFTCLIIFTWIFGVKSNCAGGDGVTIDDVTGWKVNEERWKFDFGPLGLNSLKADRFKDVVVGAVAVVVFVVVDLDF